MLSKFTNETFHEGDAFKVILGEGQQVIDMVLYKVRLGNYKLPSASRQPFSLIFKASKGLYLPQGVYRFENGKVGIFEIFITPIVSPGGDREWSFYEAVFS